MSRWRLRAVCTPADDDLLFGDAAAQRRGVVEVCHGRRCPVILECATAGMGEPAGLWGALTERTRGRSEDLLRASQAAAVLGLSRFTMRRISAEVLPFTMVGSERQYRREDVEACRALGEA